METELPPHPCPVCGEATRPPRVNCTRRCTVLAAERRYLGAPVEEAAYRQALRDKSAGRSATAGLRRLTRSLRLLTERLNKPDAETKAWAGEHAAGLLRLARLAKKAAGS